MNLNLKNMLVCKMMLLYTLAGLFLSGSLMAADDPTSRALKLYEQHHYEEASRLLGSEYAGLGDKSQFGANLELGMIELGNAKLYQGLYQTALKIELDYLKQLGKQKTGAASHLVEFYLGKALLQGDKPAEALSHLQRYIAFTGSKQPEVAFAQIELGLAYSRQKKTAQATAIWSKLDIRKPEIKAALAGAYAVSGMQKYKPSDMADAALGEAKRQNYSPTSAMLRNLLRAYTHSGSTEKALALLNANEYKEASNVEQLGASKSISFYDLSLLEDMSAAYLEAAVMHFKSAGRDQKTSSRASYFLTDAYLMQGNLDAAMHAATDFLTQQNMPESYRDSARIFQASTQYKAGLRNEAIANWQMLAEKASDSPMVLAEIISACAYTGANCAKPENIALAVVEKGEGKKYYPLVAALGKYYLQQSDYSKAILYMEAGRDKANKNKIEANDPLMLVALAEAYYRKKNYSENLEIYFELSKQFPVVRQIQEAMQGIYSMQQKSAGEVKIY